MDPRIPTLLATLKDEDPAERLGAARDLFEYLDQPGVLDALEALRRDPSRALRAFVDSGLSKRGIRPSSGARPRAAAAKPLPPHLRPAPAPRTAPRTPWGVWVLVALFAIAAVARLPALLNHTSNTSFQLFAHHGLGNAWLAVTAAIVVAQGATLFFLFERKPVGYHIGLAYLAVEAFLILLTLKLELLDPGAVRQIIAASRPAGHPASPESLAASGAAPVLIVVAVVALAALGGWAALFVANRRHFFGAVSRPARAAMRQTVG